MNEGRKGRTDEAQLAKDTLRRKEKGRRTNPSLVAAETKPRSARTPLPKAV
jgi:hypothetical protein